MPDVFGFRHPWQEEEWAGRSLPFLFRWSLSNASVQGTMSVPSLTILVPAYNEAQRIQPVLEDFATYFRENYEGHFQIVVVANGCRDNTREVVEEIGRTYREVRLIEFTDAIGKGGALIEGLKLAEETDLIGFVDADGATGPESFLTLVQQCDKADCVVGSRRMPGSIIHQAQPTKRIFASKVYHMIVQSLFWMNIKDTQCGAKVMHRKAAQAIQESLHIADMAFDINLLYSLKRGGFTVLEAPVEWTDKIGTKVTYFRTSFVMFLSVVRLRLVYTPVYQPLAPVIRPVEAWIYRKLRNPVPGETKRVDQQRRTEATESA